jgi:hypothetical protein
MEQELQGQIEGLIGSYGWMFVTGILLLLFRSAIEGAVEGFKVFVGNDLNTDDVIAINGQPARVVRVGIFKTIFFVYEVGCANGKPYVKGGSKMAVQNDKLKDFEIKKPLPMLDLSPWDDCNKEKD